MQVMYIKTHSRAGLIEKVHLLYNAVALPYRRLSNADRQCLVECFQAGSDYLALARQLAIKRQTVWSISGNS